MTAAGAHAVVLGAGMSGLMAAHVLADHFERVTVVERDADDSAGPRRGVPQGSHPHALTLKTNDLLESLFPGLLAQYVAEGGIPVGMLNQHRLYFYGHQLRQTPIGRDAVWASRPFLEHRIRERVRARTNVTMRLGWEVVGLIAPVPERITGVTLRQRGSAQIESLPADLVVDATGRGGRSRPWLRALGYPPPREERTKLGLSYATRILRCGVDALQGDRTVSIGPQPSRPQGLMFTVQEHGRWSLTVYGYGDHRPDADPDRFMAIVRALAPDDVWAVVETAQPLGDVEVFQIPTTFRRRYDALPRFPEGLLVTGDALCTVNPLYATGMMHAAAHAVILDRRLREGLDHIHRGFFRDAARVVARSWWFSTLTDSSLPGVIGPRIPGARLALWYLRRFVAAAEHDDTLAAEFVRVAGAVQAPTALVHPSILMRVLKHRPRS